MKKLIGMKKKTTKKLENLKKFQLVKENKQKIEGGIGGPTYTLPNYGQATSGSGCYIYETTICNEDFLSANGFVYGWGGCNGGN
jgi:hypothetical protein